jgi:hypothetical protein
MRIERFNAERLEAFLSSDEYRTMPFVPVSPQRALSWIHNPRLQKDDTIMYLGFEEDEMIAYRCILPDRFGDIRFGWLSGNWVRPDRRRMGMASRLFEEAYSDWGHQLMYTNYAPESKAVYDKSTRFMLFKERQGMRYYQRSSSASLLGNRRTLYRRSRPLLDLADTVLNLVQDIRIGLNKEKLGGMKIEEKEKPDLEALDFLEKKGDTGFSRRSMEDFDWITSWPWIREGRQPDPRYFFSAVTGRFRNICIKTYARDSRVNAFLWLVLNGTKMSLPYLSADKDVMPAVSRVLNYYMQSNRVAYLTSYQPLLKDHFHPGSLLGKRSMTQKYFATRDLARQLPAPESIRFQDGDGDVVFV